MHKPKPKTKEPQTLKIANQRPHADPAWRLYGAHMVIWPWPYNMPTGHTQHTAHAHLKQQQLPLCLVPSFALDNSSSFLKKKGFSFSFFYFFYFRPWPDGHGHARVYARLGHININRDMQDPLLLSSFLGRGIVF